MRNTIARNVVRARFRTTFISPAAKHALRARSRACRARGCAQSAHVVAFCQAAPAPHAKHAQKVKQQGVRRQLIRVTVNVAVRLAVHRVNFCRAPVGCRALSAHKVSSKPTPAPRAVTCVQTASTRAHLVRHFVATAGLVSSVMVRVVLHRPPCAKLAPPACSRTVLPNSPVSRVQRASTSVNARSRRAPHAGAVHGALLVLPRALRAQPADTALLQLRKAGLTTVPNVLRGNTKKRSNRHRASHAAPASLALPAVARPPRQSIAKLAQRVTIRVLWVKPCAIVAMQAQIYISRWRGR